jgi:hypothetical protein
VPPSTPASRCQLLPPHHGIMAGVSAAKQHEHHLLPLEVGQAPAAVGAAAAALGVLDGFGHQHTQGDPAPLGRGPVGPAGQGVGGREGVGEGVCVWVCRRVKEQGRQTGAWVHSQVVLGVGMMQRAH